MDTTNPQNTNRIEDTARMYLRVVEDQIDKGQYNDALAWTLDLAKELQRLHAERVRMTMSPKRVR